MLMLPTCQVMATAAATNPHTNYHSISASSNRGSQQQTAWAGCNMATAHTHHKQRAPPALMTEAAPAAAFSPPPATAAAAAAAALNFLQRRANRQISQSRHMLVALVALMKVLVTIHS
jgi:hypothetical protein